MCGARERKNEKRETLIKIGLDENFKIEIVNSTDKNKRDKYVKYLYKKLQRTGQLERDVDRLVRNDRIAFGASMVACKDADALLAWLASDEALRSEDSERLQAWRASLDNCPVRCDLDTPSPRPPTALDPAWDAPSASANRCRRALR